MRKPPEIKITRKRVILWMLAAFVIILIMLHYTFLDAGLDSVEKICGQTIENAKEKLETYDNYSANDETKSLVRLLDKTTELGNNFGQSYFSDADLDKYIEQQRITGIIILDENMNPVHQSTTDGDTYALWKEVLNADSVKEVVSYPRKVYMLRTDMQGETYDVVAIARSDAPGVIMAYVLQSALKDGMNDISPESLFSGMIIDSNGFLAVTKNDEVIAVNNDSVDKQSAQEWENLFENGSKVRNRLYRVKYDGKRQYISETRYRDYVIYMLFAVDEVYKPYFVIEFVLIMLYLLFCIGIAWVVGHVERKNYHRLQKYYQIVDAINSVYVWNLLVYTDSGRAEWIKISDSIKRTFNEHLHVGRIMKRISQVYVHNDYREGFEEFTDITTVKERLNGKKIISYTYEDIYEHWITISIIPQSIDDGGDIKAVLYLVSDVTEEMEKEKNYQKQLKLAGDAKTNFLRRMSHDIRTPINGIRGILQIAESEPENLEKQEEYRKKVDVASGYLLDLVNNVLDMSKMESGEIKLDYKPFDLVELLERTNDITLMQCKECGIAFHYDNSGITYKNLIGSPVHLQQVLLNIAGNAVKYNSENGEIFVGCREVSVNGNTIIYEFTCRDTGIGMSKEFQKRIFEPFTQENGSARTKYAGTGLGMSIVKELTELQGGTIEFKSEQGIGTEFKIRLPFRIDNSAAEKEQDRAESNVSIKGLKILLTEDNELNMEIAAHLLSERGAVVTKAHNGQEAAEIFAESDVGFFDIILMDIMMPVMGGWEATRKIRGMNRKDAATIPIIAMTANAFQDDIQHSLSVGMNAHITKPLDMDNLAEIIFKMTNK